MTNKRIYTTQELVNMSTNEYKHFRIHIRARAYRLLGFNWKKWITVEGSCKLGEELIIHWE